MEWTRLTPQTMPDFMEEVFIALNDGNYAVAWLRDNPTPTFTNIHGDVWWVHEVSHWMYPNPPKPFQRFGKTEQFYCADWNRCGSICEEQCNACNNPENMPEHPKP